jgi:hypothetical protein
MSAARLAAILHSGSLTALGGMHSGIVCEIEKGSASTLKHVNPRRSDCCQFHAFAVGIVSILPSRGNRESMPLPRLS